MSNEKVKDAKAKRRLSKLPYKATHAVWLGDNDIVGVSTGFRCFHLLKTGSKWTHLIEVVPDSAGEQRARKCENELWEKMVKKGVTLDSKGRPI